MEGTEGKSVLGDIRTVKHADSTITILVWYESFLKKQGIIPLLIIAITCPLECSSTVPDVSCGNSTAIPTSILVYHATNYNDLSSATCDTTVAC